jgi:hypothetical protein
LRNAHESFTNIREQGCTIHPPTHAIGSLDPKQKPAIYGGVQSAPAPIGASQSSLV